MLTAEVDDHITKIYEIKKRLGKGAYGIVWKAVDKKTKDIVAVKKIFDAFRNQTDAQRTFREIMFLKEFGDHPNIITLHNIYKANNNRDIYLVFEYMDTDLHNVIRQGNILNDLHKRFIMYQLFKATKYIHSGNVIHRDQKPSNILINSRCHCKVADFGLARSVASPTKSLGDLFDPALTDYVATRWYRAPEILVSSKRYTKGIDIWSLGCILAEMLLGQPLFPGSSTINQLEMIMSTIPEPSSEEVERICPGYGSSLLRRAPAGAARQPLSCRLGQAPPDAVDLVSKLLLFDPGKRLTAVEALAHPYVHRFHSEASEPSMRGDVLLPLQDDVQLSVEEYRSKLYEMVALGPARPRQRPPQRPGPERECGTAGERHHGRQQCAHEARGRHAQPPGSRPAEASGQQAPGQMLQKMTNHVWEVTRYKSRTSGSKLEQGNQLKPRQAGLLRPAESRSRKLPPPATGKQFNSYDHRYGTVTQSALLELRYSCN
ncbi:mitogen-activated protein kinase 15 [Bacillus rossius redtenbacheri]|uniref:mitogen-activated protein kinase 15 n=1 Tax=Bacillus rossius redtenbacheri TaxID=93214 RepID=UPI002FDCC74E